MIRILLFLFTLGSLGLPAAAQNADSLNTLAVSLIGQKAFEKAIPLLRQAAEAGHIEAQHNFAVVLTEGLGVTADPVEANLWMRKAADQNYVDAQYKLAYNYTVGHGVKQDMGQAFHWFERAAENGDIEAQFIVVGMLMKGQGVPMDMSAALEWAQLLAVRENPDDLQLSGKITSARLNIAQLYLTGDSNIPRDLFEAYKWLLITNENKSDFSGPYQQEIIDDIHDLEDTLNEQTQTRAREAAETTLGRPLRNVDNRHNLEH